MPASKKPLSTVILGAGPSGLAAADALAESGPVTVLDASPTAGGLAGGFKILGRPAERFYHYLCPPDSRLLALVSRLGLSDQARFKPCRLGYFQDQFHDLAPGNWLKLPLPPLDRLRSAAGMALASRRSQGARLDREDAALWIRGLVGQKAFDTLVAPMLMKKFGAAENISAAWLWHRFFRASHGAGRSGPRFGYLENGYQELFARWKRDLSRRGVRFRMSTPISSLRRDKQAWVLRGPKIHLRASRVIAAIPAPALLALKPRLDSAAAKKIRALRYRSLVQPLLLLNRPVSPFFWTNLNDPRTPFAGIIQYDRLDGSGDRPLAYLPAYVDPASPLTRAGDKKVLQAARDTLRAIEPGIKIKKSWVFRDRWAQPVTPPGFAANKPPRRVADKLFLLEASQLYPSDRSLDACLANAADLRSELT